MEQKIYSRIQPSETKRTSTGTVQNGGGGGGGVGGGIGQFAVGNSF